MLIASRKIFSFGTSEPVPSGYRRVKYIVKDDNGNPTQTLCMYQTGVYNDGNWHLETDGYSSSSYSSWCWFGAFFETGTWTGYGFAGNYGSSRPVHGNKYGQYWSTIGTGAGGNIMKCDVSSTKTTIDWNGTVRTATSDSGFNGAEIYLMGNGVNRSVCKGTGLGETIITRDGIEIAHLYPCVRISDNAHVFYDSVQKKNPRENWNSEDNGH